MHPRCCDHYYENASKKEYQLVIMHEDGMTYCVGRLYSWDEVQEAVKEIRELYAKHGVTHHVGFRKV
jgi:hypothetical protein